MASHLANIFGTEQDRVNCSFYYKIGACRHGDRCSRKHIKPPFSQTILLPNVYRNPAHGPDGQNVSQADAQADFDRFFEDFYCGLAQYGNLQEMHVCDNVGDHLLGNVYARYEWEAEAQKAVDDLNNRWYAGKPLYAELSPVTDFREACCRQNEMGECTRGGFCNFMHLSHPTKSLESSLEHAQRLERRKQSSAGGAAGGASTGNGANLPPTSNLGWVPPSLQTAPEGGPGGWQPPSASAHAGQGDHYEESWKPSY
ncbi:hypothetical protein QFC21_004546 [Naganishia friedmannii]|uniref:Uncharacterized protein n=1 Tax=Naganishia friedmannii TaxID=89922 RepID=A0ACC2VH08_9TREE|nr:hypothetical protein QFC21_004546 [Naganishia friedmannii]